MIDFRKLKSHKKYYPIVKHRSRIHHDSTCSCGEEDILGLDDPEDTIIPDSDFPGLFLNTLLFLLDLMSHQHSKDHIAVS
jgi:hypothetical protein